MNAAIQKVMENFDFENVHKAMVAVDWRWAKNEIPTLLELKITARYLLIEAYDHQARIGTGGFYARCSEGVLSLDFLLEYVNIDMDTLEEV